MNLLNHSLLSVVTFLPLAGAVLLIFLPKEDLAKLRFVAFATTIVNFLISLKIYAGFDASLSGFQFHEVRTWIPRLNTHYELGIDGISLFLVLLTTFLMILSVLASFTAITERVKEYFILMLMLETGMIGVFVSLDLLLFYLFWEGMLIPMYFLIGVWGGPRRIYASIKFFLYTLVGSVLMLVGIIYLHSLYAQAHGDGTFSLLLLQTLHIDPSAQQWLFWAFFLAFAIKVPLFPFHTWLPDAHVEAPTAGSVLLAGILLKMGTYGMLRFNLPLFPDATQKYATYVMVLAVIGIIYGALMSTVQKDIKKLVAYSSVSHLGFCVLGIFALNQEAIEGAIYQMLNHGVSTGALFIIVGVIYERAHTREIDAFGGLWKVMPLFSVFFLIVGLSSIGLPGTNGFVGEFLILMGTFKARALFGVLAVPGVILSAVYMLWALQRILYGKAPEKHAGYPDLTLREKLTIIPLIVLIFWMGIFSPMFTSK
ncbi:MAG: NADH-quinone oxidoreductase subunit M, partial [Acidobacteria bacterium]|nr:NADH-quinone oxidoreductase subunit M [Acidobacteriota bacterium]